jgi:hypothetical protein
MKPEMFAALFLSLPVSMELLQSGHADWRLRTSQFQLHNQSRDRYEGGLDQVPTFGVGRQLDANPITSRG